jgi:hypothetical protein
MSTARLSSNMTIGGRNVTGSMTVTDEAVETQEIILPAGIAGTLTTRTDDNTGVVTVASGHGITDTDTVMVSWVGGLQRVIDVTATTATTISIDLGVGDNLPVATTAVVVSKSVNSTLTVPASGLKAFAIQNRNRVYANVRDGSATSLFAKDLPAEQGYFWMTGGGYSDPTTGTAVGSIQLNNLASTADTIVVATLKNTI